MISLVIIISIKILNDNSATREFSHGMEEGLVIKGGIFNGWVRQIRQTRIFLIMSILLSHYF